MLWFAIVALLASGIPALVFFLNLRLYQPPPAVPPGTTLPPVSILIPARNEAAGIADALTAALATRAVDFEILVMDDSSTDTTAAIVQAFAASDTRVRLLHAPALPAGWNGKQHACWALAHAARHPTLCFVDADVRLHPDCIARMAAFLAPATQGRSLGAPSLDSETWDSRTTSEVGAPFTPESHPEMSETDAQSTTNALVSGFPQELTGSPLEWLLLPLIHFVLLGFLPLGRMRAGTDPAFAAGCGQFLMASRDAYFQTGGHSAIRETMHDGLRLPRLFRQHGLRTDLADLTPLATCRMYRTARETWLGLAKNATEGLAAPARIVPITLLLLIGQVLPFISLAYFLLVLVLLVLYRAVFGVGTTVTSTDPLVYAGTILGAILLSCAFAWAVRIAAARRFRQDWRSALLHPIGILVLLFVQWYALIRQLAGRKVTWRDRAYTSDKP